MTIKKLTLAAVLTVGIAVSSMTLATASEAPVVIGAACPLAGCSTPITPSTATCPSCMKAMPDCECQKPDRGCKMEDPCASDCDCEEPKCRCQEDDSPCKPTCEEPSVPACASCPNTDCDILKRQVYAYPQYVFGTPNYTGTESNGVGIGYDGLGYAYNGATYNGAGAYTTGAAAPINGCGCNSGCLGVGVPVSGCHECPQATGAAANIPIISNGHCCGGGINVDRNPQNLDSAGCPIDIQSSSSMEGLKKSLVPYEISTPTGAAAPLISAFEDIPPGFWAGCDINKLTTNNIIAGYPDRTFKPNLPISRAEIASMITKGLNVDIGKSTCPSKMFSDVPSHFWANKAINNAVTAGLMAGYPDNTFKPNQPVSKTEAMTILSKGINCPMDDCKADSILSQYCDGKNVPNWAKIPVAKVLEAGALQDNPQPNLINPQKDASRAELASMLQNVRVAIGYDTNDKVSLDDCDCTGGAAFIEKEEVVTIPTLQVCFNDEISAKSAQVGDKFSATTTEEISINGCNFPCGSRVYGHVVEVIRPTAKCQGALRLVFDRIQDDCHKADLPQQILSAQVNKEKKNNFIVKAIEAPFTLLGGLIGVTGRTVGGIVTNVGNSLEGVSQGVGVATGELSRAEFRASGRSLFDAGKTLVMAPVQATGTTLSGVTGLLQYTGDEMMYLVDAKGMKVSSINPKEKVTIAFGCN